MHDHTIKNELISNVQNSKFVRERSYEATCTVLRSLPGSKPCKPQQTWDQTFSKRTTDKSKNLLDKNPEKICDIYTLT